MFSNGKGSGLNPFFPVNLNINGRLCVIVGGGQVALRKVAGLLACGPRLLLISPTLVDGLHEIVDRAGIEWLERDYVRGDLKGAFLAVAATSDRDVQDLIRDEAYRFSVLLNSADDPRACDFQVPASFNRGDLQLTVSTGGGSPALASRIRKQLETQFGPEYSGVVGLLRLVRDEIVVDGEEQSIHSQLFHTLLDRGVVEMVLESRWFDLQMLLLEELPETIDGVALLRRFLEKFDSLESPV